jgi:predicted ArsR family transcriptional regulator
MKPRWWQIEIIALVQRNGFVSAEALAAQLAVPARTLRRDVDTLCDANLLSRRHGGAANVDPAVNVSYDARRVAGDRALDRPARAFLQDDVARRPGGRGRPDHGRCRHHASRVADAEPASLTIDNFRFA